MGHTFCLRLWHATQLFACLPRFRFFTRGRSSAITPDIFKIPQQTKTDEEGCRTPRQSVGIWPISISPKAEISADAKGREIGKHAIVQDPSASPWQSSSLSATMEEPLSHLVSTSAKCACATHEEIGQFVVTRFWGPYKFRAMSTP
jgi:hypothetical protein